MLSICAATLPFFLVTPNGPAKAQVALLSAYAQTTNMVDGFDVGSWFADWSRYGSPTIVGARSSRAGVPADRRSMSDERPGARGDRARHNIDDDNVD
jgi:hypothetical protein